MMKAETSNIVISDSFDKIKLEFIQKRRLTNYDFEKDFNNRRIRYIRRRGIQADLKTFQEHGTYGMTAFTVVVTMDPDNNWTHGVYSFPIDVLKAQIKTALSTGIDAIKTGMLSTEEVIQIAGNAIANLDLTMSSSTQLWFVKVKTKCSILVQLTRW